MNLSDLVEKMETGTIRVGRKSVAARALSGTDHTLLRVAMPKPVAPLGPDVTAGGMNLSAPFVPNEHDPGHNARLERWWAMYRCAAIAIGTGASVPGLGAWKSQADEAARARWAEQAGAMLCDGLTLEQVQVAFDALDRLGSDLEGVLGNSGAGPADGPPPTS